MIADGTDSGFSLPGRPGMTTHLQDKQATARGAMSQPDAKTAAEAVRAACLRAALEGYERAGFGGMCEEGRWEMVVDAIKSLDVDAVLASLPATPVTSAGTSIPRTPPSRA